MTRSPETDPLQKALSSLDRSGFPFQTAVAAVIAEAPGWRLARSEFPWTDRRGADQFLDLVATDGTHFLGIECKKARDDAYTFLLPGPAVPDTDETLCLHAVQTQDSIPRTELFNSIWHVAPPSPATEFCVATSAPSGSESRLLERTAQTLVRGTDAFAQFRQTYYQPGQSPANTPVLFLPVIVTNSPLFVFQYDPVTVPLGRACYCLPDPLSALSRGSGSERPSPPSTPSGSASAQYLS